jgi:hypothetical protein
MKQKALVLTVLLSFTLACGFLGKSNDSIQDSPFSEKHTSDSGGFTCGVPDGWSVDSSPGLTILLPADGNKDSGPVILLAGKTVEASPSNDDLMIQFQEENAAIKVGKSRKIDIGTTGALMTDISGNYDGNDIAGSVVVAVQEPQQYMILAFAPKDDWQKDTSTLFDAVIDSLRFFDPTGSASLPGEPQPDIEPEQPAREEPAPDRPTAERPQSQYDLAPGSFAFEVKGADEDTVIESSLVQYQSTTEDYVIGLSQEGDLARYVTSLILAREVAPGQITMLAYDKSKAAKAPSAAIFVGAWFYYATQGSIWIDSMDNNAISGSFMFTAAREDDPGITITVSGEFKEIPLK